MAHLTKSENIQKKIHKKHPEKRSKQENKSQYKYNKYEKIQQYKSKHSPHNTNQYLLSKFNSIEQDVVPLSTPESILDLLIQTQ